MSREVKDKEEREDRKIDSCEDETAAERGRDDGRKCKTRWENLLKITAAIIGMFLLNMF